MKINQLKSIIKEAVREEVKDIIEQAIAVASSENRVENRRYDLPSPSEFNTGSIYEKLKEGINPHDLKNFSDQSIEHTQQNYQEGMMEQINPTGPLPGISAAQLPFIKKAGEIYKKSKTTKNKFLD